MWQHLTIVILHWGNCHGSSSQGRSAGNPARTGRKGVVQARGRARTQVAERIRSCFGAGESGIVAFGAEPVYRIRGPNEGAVQGAGRTASDYSPVAQTVFRAGHSRQVSLPPLSGPEPL